MSKKDFLNVLTSSKQIKVGKYNHYKPFQDPPGFKSGLLQTGNKQDTNETQNEHKVDTNETQSEHKLNTKTPLIKEIGHKPDTERNTKVDTNWTQKRHKLDTKDDFSSLVGLQRNLTFYIYNECKIARSKTTRSLSIEHISFALKVPKGSIKTTIKRLEGKGIIERSKSKTGRGGWSSYTIPNSIFQEVLQYETGHKLDTNWTQIGHKLDTERDTERDTNSSVVSSYMNITTTNEELELTGNWKGINFSDLESAGFNRAHLIQIIREFEKNPNIALSPEIVQDSIDAFAFDLKHNDIAKDFKKPAVVVFISLLKKGTPYSCKTPEKFVTPREAAMKEYSLKKEIQREAKQKIQKELRDVEFKIWQENLTEAELLELCPESESPKGPTQKIQLTLRRRRALEMSEEYFNAVIWPIKLEEITKEIDNQLQAFKQETRIENTQDLSEIEEPAVDEGA